MRNQKLSSNRIQMKKKNQKGIWEMQENRTETVFAFGKANSVAFIVLFDGSKAAADY